MLRLALRALAVAFYTLAAAAMIVDARREGGLPEGFPLLAQLREVRERLAPPGGSTHSSSPQSAARPSRLRDAVEPAPDPWPGDRVAERGSGALDEQTAHSPPLPSGSPGVQVNRGLP